METAIAVVGMSGRFPQAETLERFWQNLRGGIESVRPIPEEDLLAAGVSPATLRDPAYVPAAGVLEGVDLFDAPFFGLSAREAALLDPQHRLLLEMAWEALEAAGYDAERLDRPVGVYAGASVNSYFLHYLFSPREQLNAPDGADLFVGNDNNFLATRISYKLGLRGPGLTVQTACSTSLVAVHLACQSLLNGECDMALAGGVSVRVPQVGYFYRPGGILAPDGHCRAFDAAAGGSVMGSGAGLVVLKRLEDALADRDPVRAVILGSAVTNDGSLRIGYTAPGAEGQAAAISEALALARVEPQTVRYVEAHGSGTPLGDPIEMAALRRAFGPDVEPCSCAVGSVKTNIGHLDAAAGIAGLIKTVLALEHAEIPPSLHFSAPNPQVDFASSPFYVSAALEEWTADGAPRRAGVSSFGMGGTNAHAILEEAPAQEPSGPSRPWQLLLLSTATPTALDAATDALAAHLEAHPEEPLADVAYTLSAGRKVMRHRRALVVQDGADAARTLAVREPGRLLEGSEERTDRAIAFLLPGLGEHYPGMGRGLYESEPVFREAVDLCCRHLEPHLGLDLRRLLYPADIPRAEGLDFKALVGRTAALSSELDRTAYAQPALFVAEYALAQLWKEWGVEPAALLGYSLGEYTAACLAGVFSLQDALRVVALRAQQIERLPAGAMLAVPLPEAEVLPLLGESLSLAAVNGPEVCVVGGPPEAVQALEERLAERGLTERRLRTSHAFHSPMMQPIAGELARLLASVQLAAPQLPYLSNVTGTWIEAAEAVDPAYWVRHLLAPVRLADGLARLWQGKDRVLLEVGPGAGLSSLALQHPASSTGSRIAVPSLPGAHEPRPDQAFALGALGRLWLGGARLDGTGLWQREERNRLRLPTYPFERRRYWVEERKVAVEAAARLPQEPAVPSTTLHSRPPLPTPYAAPIGPEEETLAAVWQELLGVEPIGRHDNFFDLGGHSLLAVQLMARLAERFGADLPVATLFEAPTVALLSESVQAARVDRPQAPPLVPAPRTGDLPLSFAQERLWFLDRLIPDSPIYHVPMTTRLRGRLRRPVLAASLREVANRHEVLRTTFGSVGDRPVQVISPEPRLDLPLIDLAGLPAERREAEAQRRLAEEVAWPFDLARGPLVRALLVRLAEEDHLARFNLHHIVSDGWSLGVLMQDLSAIYRAFAAGEPSPLPTPPVQYADYAVWQRGWLQGERLEEQIAYWRERLQGAPAVLDLPLDRPRPAVQRFQGLKIPFRLAPEAFAGLPALQRAHQATLFMVLLAAFETLLSHLTGQEDVVVGSPVAGRSRRETENLIGFFVNTLALRGDLSGDPRFEDLLAQVRKVTIEGYAREDLPFERLVEHLQPQRSLSHSPVFQAVLVLQNAPFTALELPGLHLETVETWVEGTKFDLTVSVLGDTTQGLEGYLEYDRDLFDAATAQRFTGYFLELFTAAVAAPERRLSELPWLSAPERHQLLLEWNGGEAQFPSDETLHGWFAATAARRPEAEAVWSEGGSLTYRELDLRSGRLARRLAELGVGPEVPVALCLERGTELVVALLAVLKAGGAYVPIDPHYPGERQAWVLEACGAPVLVSETALASNLPPTSARQLLLDELDLETGEALDPVPGELAYVIYTSGSTGRPKGVMVDHRQAVRLFRATEAWYGFGPHDTWTLFHSYAFDFSVWEIWGALLYGGRLVVVPHWVSRSPEAFHDLLRRQKVTVLNQTPQAFRQLAMADPELEPLSDLRVVIFGGEALELASLAPWWERYGDERPRLINMYGITETTVFNTYRPVSQADLAGTGPAPIGKALPDLTLQVLDRRQQPVAMGVPGELYVGGAGVARGYLGRPDLTAERFVPDPFASEPGARLYRSGDLVRYRPDGDLEHLGRIDHQVKIRGYRIELGEIEGVLSSHPEVAQAVAVVREEPGGERRLTAYLVAVGDMEETAPAELREFARRHLPEPMVPAVFTVVDALPMNPSGKVDRRALATRPIERQTAATYRPPADEMEALIAELWQEVLGLEQVGVDDNFFDLGGHSLALVQLQKKLRERLSREISIVELFRAPTVSSLARSLAEAPADSDADTETPAPILAARQGDERAQARRAWRDRRRQETR
ncbi:MAG TPA: amino acid adenylation domain-containing protein [Thermoanaerobaculia bacterium]|nr:amino acid adenylation domain-containing protein [Thermoanaerobaculia bacterium]